MKELALINRRPIAYHEASQKKELEISLFRDGVLTFDLDEFVRYGNKELEDYQSFLTQYKATNARERFEEAVMDKHQEMWWQERFSGHIPKRWGGPWMTMYNDLGEARKHRVQLSEPLVEAGIMHWMPLIAGETGICQRLTLDQLLALFTRPDPPALQREKIIDWQLENGISERKMREILGAADATRSMRERAKVYKPPADRYSPLANRRPIHTIKII